MKKSNHSDDILLLSNNDNHTVMLTDLKRINIEGFSKQKNNKMSAYLHLLVDDIYLFNGDFELGIEISLSENSQFMGIMLEQSYPYYRDCIFVSFDLKVKASNQALSEALDAIDTDDADGWGDKGDITRYIDCSIGDSHELMLNDYMPVYIEYGCQLNRNLKLVDQALYFDNNLVKTFYANNIPAISNINIPHSSFLFSLYGIDNSMPVIAIESPFLLIKISNKIIEVIFGDFNKLLFTTTDNFQRDLNMIKLFTKSFIEKTKDHDIDDLKSEILLMDMEHI